MKQYGLIIVAVLASIATVATAVFVANQQTGQNTVTVSEQSCRTGQHTSHAVVIKNDKVSPEHTQAKLCDQLMITNLDKKERLIAFGKHDHHTKYDGVEERTLTYKQSFTVTLVETGEYLFHDHEQDEVSGTFSVAEK